MADHSTIEWLQRPGTKPATWNPIRARDRETGKRGWFCVHAHEGCRICYAEAQNVRKGNSGGNGHAYKAQNLDKVDVYLDEKTLLQPLHWQQPRTIFVCSMSDVYGSWVKDEWLDKIKAVEALTPQHTYIELTKRPERMRAYNTALYAKHGHLVNSSHDVLKAALGRIVTDELLAALEGGPFPNVWGCVSCSEQKDADLYIPDLLATPLAVRGVSAEPLLGLIDFGTIEAPDKVEGERWTFNALTDGDYYEQWSETMLGESRRSGGDGPYREHKLDWIIVGGESGKGARLFIIEHADAILEQCKAAGVACFVKQLGALPISSGYPLELKSKKGGDWNEWPDRLRVREFPEVAHG